MTGGMQRGLKGMRMRFSPIAFAEDSSFQFPPDDGGCIGTPDGRGIGWPIPEGGVKGVGVNGGTIGVGIIRSRNLRWCGSRPRDWPGSRPRHCCGNKARGVVQGLTEGSTGSGIWEGEVFS